MDYKKLLSKKISVGLNLSEPEEDIYSFIDLYKSYISSIYFSLPLGKKFYSRNELEDEYTSCGSERKLFRIIEHLKNNDIRTEVAINNYGLTDKELTKAVAYMSEKQFKPDEIVCLKEYGALFKAAYPDIELKYSFNNPDESFEIFDTVVVGKAYLRNPEARHKIIDSGKGLVLLLNNGCSFQCHYPCGNSKFCGSILDKNLEHHDINYIYALQSFFPSELKTLLLEDSYAAKYKFKISNRPLGLAFTRSVLDAYCGLSPKTERDLFEVSTENYGLFCVMNELFRRREQFDCKKIMAYKKNMNI